MSAHNDPNEKHRQTYEELDVLLRNWHTENREAAMRRRDEILAALADRPPRKAAKQESSQPSVLWSFLMHRYTRVAASLILLFAVAALLFPPIGEQSALAGDEGVIMLPEGGRLDAFDDDGELIGPCPLKHTDVKANISGHFARVNVTQRYVNTYESKIEAVYTFPLSHRGAVDRMTMTIGDRVVVGEVKEREEARQIYEAAREQGYVASLLEQERPNIFTQSVANIEPGEEVLIEISYVEILQSVDGEYTFDFPMVVAPRYIPGYPVGDVELPKEVQPRRGVVLLGPASFTSQDGVGERTLAILLGNATPINQPPASFWGETGQPETLHHFTATYADGAKEFGILFAGGIGILNGRWFHYDQNALAAQHGEDGGAFSPDTDQVPDASRITPMPVRPEKRAGHTISLTVDIDTGGPGIVALNSPQHAIMGAEFLHRRGEPDAHASIALKPEDNIPNRDFLLTWKTTSDTIEEAVFTHTGDYGDFSGGFFTFILNPPAKVAEENIRPRELIFVLDNSGSMAGFSIEAAKKVINKAINTMRPDDRFNVISFNNTTDALWDMSQPNTFENRAAAQRYIDMRQGGGGTEMRSAVFRALEAGDFERKDRPRLLSPMELANLPADGREVQVAAPPNDIASGQTRQTESGCDRVHYLRLPGAPSIEMCLRAQIPNLDAVDAELKLVGRWITESGRRSFVVDRIEPFDRDAGDDPMRIVLFVTDGLVGNDAAIIKAVRENAGRTRLFTIGMSRSPNRYLLDEMAIAGRGAADYALPNDDVEPIVARFAERIATPVLTDIRLAFSPELNVLDVASDGEGGFFAQSADRLPDLFDMQPLVIHGRYQPGEEPVRGRVTIRGRTGAGPYERTLDIELPAAQSKHDVIATLWARSKVGQLSRTALHDAQPIIALGQAFQIMTEHTSFVAVEKLRVTVDGKPMLVRVPIEFPKDMSWEGIFGPDVIPVPRPSEELVAEVRQKGIDAALADVRQLVGKQNHQDALKMTNAILEVEELNPAALLLRDVLQSKQLYSRYREIRQVSDDQIAFEGEPISLKLKGQIQARMLYSTRAAETNASSRAEPTAGRISFPWYAGREQAAESGSGGGFGRAGGAPQTNPNRITARPRAESAQDSDARSRVRDRAAAPPPPSASAEPSPPMEQEAANSDARFFAPPRAIGELREIQRGRTTEALSQYPDDWTFAEEHDVIERAISSLVMIDVQNEPLEDVLTFITQATGISIEPDWDALEEIGISSDAKVSLALPEAPALVVMQLVLQHVAGDAEFAIVASDDAIHIADAANVHDGFLLNLSGMAAEEIYQRELIRRVHPQLRAKFASEPVGDALVSVLLHDVDESTLKQLAEAGLEIEAVVERGPFVVGRIDLTNVPEMALLGGVRRVELVETD